MSDHLPSLASACCGRSSIPVGVLAVIGAVLYLFSRVPRRVTPTAATITALVVAASDPRHRLDRGGPAAGDGRLVAFDGRRGHGDRDADRWAGAAARSARRRAAAGPSSRCRRVGAATKGFRTEPALGSGQSLPVHDRVLRTTTSPGASACSTNVAITQEKTVDPTGRSRSGRPSRAEPGRRSGQRPRAGLVLLLLRVPPDDDDGEADGGGIAARARRACRPRDHGCRTLTAFLTQHRSSAAVRGNLHDPHVRQRGSGAYAQPRVSSRTRTTTSLRHRRAMTRRGHRARRSVALALEPGSLTTSTGDYHPTTMLGRSPWRRQRRVVADRRRLAAASTGPSGWRLRTGSCRSSRDTAELVRTALALVACLTLIGCSLVLGRERGDGPRRGPAASSAGGQGASTARRCRPRRSGEGPGRERLGRRGAWTASATSSDSSRVAGRYAGKTSRSSA
mgnify:CR=1 FL=1